MVTFLIVLAGVVVSLVLMYANGLLDGPTKRPRREHWIWKHLR